MFERIKNQLQANNTLNLSLLDWWLISELPDKVLCCYLKKYLHFYKGYQNEKCIHAIASE